MENLFESDMSDLLKSYIKKYINYDVIIEICRFAL